MLNINGLFSRFKNPPKGYGLVPFWFWNDDLKEEHLLFQIREMYDKGIEGFIIHARKGLEVSYLSEGWFCKVEIALKEARRLDMGVWIYDEDNWPSGYAGERVIKENPDFCGKHLKMAEAGEQVPESCKLVAVIGNKCFYQDYTYWNPAYSEGCYVDMLNKHSTESFIKHTHEQYYLRFKDYFGSTIKGFFVDEPGFYNNFTMYENRKDHNTITWTDDFPEYFEKKKGYDIRPHLINIWQNTEENTTRYRIDYYEVLGAMYRENFLGTLRKFCEGHNVKLIGHLHSEEFLPYHVKTQGDLLKGIGELHYSGIDRIDLYEEKVAEKYGSSAAHIYGQERTISETFANSMWGLTLKDIKQWTNWQYVRGINMMLPHAFYSSVAGDRKWECPPSLFFQNYYWKYFKKYSDFVKRLSFILTQGHHVCPVAVYYPITTQYELLQPDCIKKCQEIDKLFVDVSNRLLDYQFDYDYINDDAFEKAEIIDKLLAIGDEKYKAIVLVEIANLPAGTVKALNEFMANGGTVVVIGNIDIRSTNHNTSEVNNGIQLNLDKIRHIDNYSINKRYTYNFDGKRLADILLSEEIEEVKLTVHDKDIKYMLRKFEDSYLYYFINESKHKKDFYARIKQTGRVYRLNPYNGQVEDFEKVTVDHSAAELEISLVPYGEILLLVTDKIQNTEYINTRLETPIEEASEVSRIQLLNGKWEVEINGEIRKLQLQTWDKWGIPEFSGKLQYTKKFTTEIGTAKRALLDLGVVYDCAEVFVNNRKVEDLTWEPYTVDITDFIRDGLNEVKIIISNTIGNELEKKFYQSGLLGPVKIIII